ncbi:hypothetical protein VTO42DRAFT_1424 [Malbranchea cinnamomea]
MAPVSRTTGTVPLPPGIAHKEHLAKIEALLSSSNLRVDSNDDDINSVQLTTTRSLPSADEVADVLTARSESTTHFEPGKGSIDPGSINMQGLLALFAIIGAAFVLGGIWFFFWAKNGGFVWRKGDWEDYKSTVLRRKGPDGRTLSNATKSTKLGGGSIVHGSDGSYTDYDGDDVTRTMTGSGNTYAATETSEKSRKKRRGRIREKFRRKRKGNDWEGEGEHDEDVRAYRDEKPAQVGGLNREADGTYHDGSTGYASSNTNPQGSEWTPSEAGDGGTRYDDYRDHQGRVSEREQQQRNFSGFSFTAGVEDTISYVTEEHRLRDETSTVPSHRQSHRHHRSSRRPRGPRPSTRQSSPKKRDNGYTTPLDMSSVSASDYQYEKVAERESGTRSYHHPIPELSKGYRRDARGRGRRRDSLSDSDGDDYGSRYS